MVLLLQNLFAVFDHETDRSRWSRLFWLAILAALLARLIWAVLIPVDPVSDSFAYDTFARNLAEHGVYGWTPDTPSAYWAVGTSAVYGAFYRVFGTDSYVPIVFLNLFAGMACVFFSGLLAAKWFGTTAGVFTAFLMAFWPAQVMFTTVLASEILFNAALLAALWVVESRKPSILSVVLASLLLGLATYIKPIALLVPFGFALVWLIRGMPWRATVGYTVLSMTLIVLTVAPWSYRNTELFGQFVFLSTNGGTNFWMGNNPETSGEYQPLPDDTKKLDEVTREAVLKARATEYIKSEPVEFVTRTAVKAVRLYERETIGVLWNQKSLEAIGGDTAILAAKVISQIYYLGALALGLLGIVLGFKRDGAWFAAHPTVLMIVYVTAVHAIIVIQDRYHFPAIPFIAACAGLAFAQLMKVRVKGDA